MTQTVVEHVRLAGLVSVVPSTTTGSAEDAALFGEDEVRRVVRNTGIISRHVARNLNVSDMALIGAERVLRDLDWGKDSVDLLILVTQCPDYPVPATSILLQTRLGLSTKTACLDINLGCSGYVYGLSIAGSMLAAGAMRRALLIVGDTSSRGISPHDRGLIPLFGDAVSVTALEYSADARPMHFVMGTDGSGAPHLFNRLGGYRHRFSPAGLELREWHDGVLRADEHTYMNGAEVLTFALKNVPSLITDTLSGPGWSIDDVDHVVYHQASRFMLKNLSRASKIPDAKVPYGMESRGNASSASIPLAMTDMLGEKLGAQSAKLVLVGFGVGWSWAAVALEAGPILAPPAIVADDVKTEPEL